MRAAFISKRNFLFRARWLLRLVGRASGSSHAVALGMGIGFLIGWMPFPGTQTVIALLVCHLVRANKAVTVIPVWLTNPVTFVPVFTFNYWVGWKLVGGPPLSDIVTALRKLVYIPDGADGRGWLAAWWEETRSGLSELLSMGWDMQLPLWLGSFLVGLGLAVVFYFLTKKFVASFRVRMREKKQRERERRRRERTLARSIVADNGICLGSEQCASEFKEPADAVAGREQANFKDGGEAENVAAPTKERRRNSA